MALNVMPELFILLPQILKVLNFALLLLNQDLSIM